MGSSALRHSSKQAGEKIFRQQADVLGEHGNDALQDETPGGVARFAAGDQRIENIGNALCGLAGDFDPVVAENRDGLARVKKIERGMAGGEVLDRHAVKRLVQLRVEIVNPEFVEVAKHDVRRAMRDEIEPVIEGLLVVTGKFLAARLHFNQHAAWPDEIGEFCSVAGKADAIFERGAFRQGIGVVIEGFEQMEKKRLGFAFFVTFEFGSKVGEVLKSPFL